jgi:hypothetical protein
MEKVAETLRSCLYFFIFLLVLCSQVFADICEDSLLEFQINTESLLNKRMIAFDDLNLLATNYSQLKSKVERESCGSSALQQTLETRKIIKEKRLETVSKYLKLGIKEEAGKDLSSEFDYLSGKSNKFKYEFEDLFSSNVKEISRPQKVSNSETKPPIINSSNKALGNCSNTILENESVNLHNVRDQDSVGWCYAYAGADLLSFKLNKKISAVSLWNSGRAVDIDKDINFSGQVEGGIIEDSFLDYLKKKNGLCLEENLPSNDFKFCLDQKYKAFINNLLKVADDKRFEHEISTNQCFGDDLRSAFPQLDFGMIKNHMNRFGSRKLVEFLYDNQCKKLSFQGLKVESVSFSSTRVRPESLISKLDEQITNGNPVGLAYDYLKLVNKGGTGGHGSLVVGRRTNPDNGACEYLVRNSWGKNCNENDGNGLACHKNCDSEGCRYSGHFWVSSERLQSSILGVTYLK